jgi:hypothetical protein
MHRMQDSLKVTHWSKQFWWSNIDLGSIINDISSFKILEQVMKDGIPCVIQIKCDKELSPHNCKF